MGRSQLYDVGSERAPRNAGKKVGTKRPLTQKRIRAVWSAAGFSDTQLS